MPAILGPTIDVQPQNATVVEGATHQFSVTATGTGTITYQWRKNTVPIGGATASTYTIPPAQLSDNGASFDVECTDDNGTTTSDPAILTVTAAASARTARLRKINTGARISHYVAQFETADQNFCTLTIGPDNSIYVVQQDPGRILRISENGNTFQVLEVAGFFGSGFVTFCDCDKAGNIVWGNNSGVWRTAANGQTNIAAGHLTTTGDLNGAGRAARFTAWALGVSASNHIYIADTDNSKIRKIDPIGVVTTLAGTGADGHTNGSTPVLNGPKDLLVDAAENVFFVDAGTQIRKVNAAGFTTTPVDISGAYPSSTITAIAMDTSQNIYAVIHSTGSSFPDKIVKVGPHGGLSEFAHVSSGYELIEDLALDRAGNLYVLETN